MSDSPPEGSQPDAGAAPVTDSAGQPPDEDTAAEGTRRRIRRLPPEVGAVLITVGVAGVLLPGPIGAPFLLAGGLALMPSVFGRFERWIEKRYPTLHWHGMRNVDRFIDNLERRFPPEASADEKPPQ